MNQNKDVTNYLAKQRENVKGHVNQKFISIIEAIGNISGSWNPVEIFTPSVESVRTEKKHFFEAFKEGKEYNPKFEYTNNTGFDPVLNKNALIEKMHELEHLEINEKDKTSVLIRKALYSKINDDLATCDLVAGLQEKDEVKIAEAMRQKYQGVDDSLLKHATIIFNDLINKAQKGEQPEDSNIKSPLAIEERNYLHNTLTGAIGIKRAFEWALEYYGILRTGDDGELGFKVVVNPEATDIDVRDKSTNGPTVFIPENKKMSLSKLLFLVAHEIEGHARQSINGQLLLFFGGGPLKIDNETLYEGLSMRYETQFRRNLLGEDEVAPLPYFTFAVAKAEKGGSFYEIFSEIFNLILRVELGKSAEELVSGDEDEYDEKKEKAMHNAWTTVYRIMRGHIDTSNPNKYAMAKDLSYLRGWIVDKQLRNEGLGFLNEAAITTSDGLELLKELKLSKSDLPIPFKDIATRYWEEILKPEIPKL